MKRIDADELMDYERMAMAEYIKREDALRILEDGEYWPIGKLYDDILHLPAADVAEARHGKWISVKDSLPQTDGSYLVCTNKGAVCTLHYYTGVNCFSAPAGKNTIYWMPLPEPPQGVKECSYGERKEAE